MFAAETLANRIEHPETGLIATMDTKHIANIARGSQIPETPVYYRGRPGRRVHQGYGHPRYRGQPGELAGHALRVGPVLR